MNAPSKFSGFPRECVQFYEDLKKNNNKEWYEAHKGDFQKYVMSPAQEYVVVMGEMLKQIAPCVVADPRMDKSIFRPFRDVRFSKDKAPYKTHLGIFFWEGTLRKMDCPGFYLHLEPPNLMLGVGNHCFSRDILELYRESVVDPKHGKSLARSIEAVKAKGPYEIGVKQYKKPPRGYEKTHANLELLLYGGLTAMCETSIPEEFYSEEILEYTFERFRGMAPIHQWLLEMIGRLKK